MVNNAKIIGNASYGVFGEGISDHYYKGKLYLPSIPISITAYARFCTNLVELVAKIKNLAKPLYRDTDTRL